MDKPVLYIIGAFFVISGLDYIAGSPLKLGNKFEEGFKTMGILSLGIIGIYSVSPFLLVLMSPFTLKLSVFLHIDPSILPACVFPVDMGGYQISKNLSQSALVGRFSGIIIASTLGATVSFSIPVACGFVRREDEDCFAKGVVIGIITIIPGCFFAGMICGIGAWELTRNMAPLFVIIVLLSMGLVLLPEKTLKGFKLFGRIITTVSIAGILLQGLNVILGLKLLPNLVPFKDAVFLVGKITLILAGAYPMMEFLNRILKRYFEKFGRLLKINSDSVAAIIGNLASNLLVFGTLRKMNNRGKVLCSSLAVSGAFVFGGQFAYVASVEPGMTGPFFLCKLISGMLSVLLVLYFPQKNTKNEITDKTIM